ncbi:ParB N-terminal domain-containing protein [Caulobacter segnis]|uniref:ParB/RepB/Spo0J family partition protein n=1 Tax=Caulobacter segnis TaxID=88688 RepID=UPI0028664A7B|nr:ParB N-terminal domain-containing protein [Caulobacter segnis]MDR6623828.1 ParB family chromosome partitioning protein [Caulobacter segnis]
MKLAFADPRNMTISPLNMRHGRPAPDTSDIDASIRQRGVLLALLVLEKVENGAVVPGRFEIVAGRRRWFAAMAAIKAGVDIDPVPIGILEPGDDAAAIEASLIENLQHLPPDEVTCWETFAKLIKKGRTPEEIAATFHMSDAVVRRTLALGNLLPRLRTLHRQEAIEVATVRLMTLATKAQQREWLALFDDPDQRAPTGAQLKAWLFGGAPIATKSALFSLNDYPGQIRGDLFGEDSYFTEPDLFWHHQNAAVAARRDALLADGWSGVEVLEIGKPFDAYNHVRASKTEGGKVYIAIHSRGDVTVHEGWLSTKEVRRAQAAAAKAARGEAGETSAGSERAEVTSAQQNYIDLHRHAAVRAVLADHPGVALRLLLAHVVAGARHVQAKVDPRKAASEAIAASLAASPGEAAFRARRAAVAARVGLSGDGDIVGARRPDGATGLFAKLLSLPDADVLAFAAVVMGETLAAGSAEAEAAGLCLKVDMGAFWSPDQAFFDLIRDREAINAMLAEVGGKKVADGNVGEKIKTQKAILRDFLEGTNDRPKVQRWTPKWLTFPAGAYTGRPCPMAERGKAVAPLLRRVRPPVEPAPVPDVALTCDPNPAILAAE